MKKSFILLLAMIGMFYFTEKSHAGFLIEPYAGMMLGSEVTDDNGDTTDLTGTAVGARVGFQNLGLMLGLDARQQSWTLEGETDDSDYTFTTMGAFVGYDFPILLRVWGEYVFSHEGENSDDNIKVTEGSGTILGLGYKIIPFVSLNLEIGNFETKKMKSDLGENDYSGKYNTYLLSVSIPLSI